MASLCCSADDCSMSYHYHVPSPAQEGQRTANLIDAYIDAWTRCDFSVRLVDVGGRSTLLSKVSEELCDTPDNPLRTMLVIVAGAAKGHDMRDMANKLMHDMAVKQAEYIVERESL